MLKRPAAERYWLVPFGEAVGEDADRGGGGGFLDEVQTVQCGCVSCGSGGGGGEMFFHTHPVTGIVVVDDVARKDRSGRK